MKFWILAGVAILAVTRRGDCLQCYACENCDSVSCMEPSYCGPIIVPELPLETTQFSPPLTTETTIPREESSTVSAVRYTCYKADIKVDNKIIKRRGCFEFLDGEDACRVIENVPYVEASNCETCTEDGCNGSSALRQPSMTLFGILLLRCILYRTY